MALLRRTVQRLFNALRPEASEADLSREMHSHLAMLEDDYRRRGLSIDEARRAARRAFGGIEQAKELQRDARAFRWIDDAARDVRYAVRVLKCAPAFSGVAILTLTLGIGANSAIFTVINGVLLKQLPYPEPDRLVGIVQRHTSFGTEFTTWPDYLDWRDRAGSLQSVAGAWTRSYNLTGVDEPERLDGAAVTDTFFTTLGVSAEVGRNFNPDDKDDPRSVVISHELWQRRFGRAPDVAGRAIYLNGVRHQVVGVMPAGFAWPAAAELWVPFVAESGMTRGYHMLQVVGRLRPDATISRVRAELDTIAAVAAAAYPQFNHGWGVEVSSLLEHTVGATSRPLIILAGAAACVLLIACTNVAALLISRSRQRGLELSMRTALGASRARIVRQLVTESLVLAIAGGAGGLALAAWGVPALLALTTLPRAAEVSLDAAPLAVTLLGSLATGLLLGVATALTGSRASMLPAMRVRGSAVQGWTRPALLVVEVATAVVLLAGAGLLLRSFYNLRHVETGVNVDRLLTTRFFMPRASYPVERCIELYERIIERVSALPDVEAAAAASVFPFTGTSANVVFTIPGRTSQTPGELLTADFSAATPGYFETLRIPVLAGRTFTASDRADAPFVAVVNRAMAARYFRGQDPLGHVVRILGPVPRTIVGVIPDLRQRGFDVSPQPEIYVPHMQFPTGGMFLVVRARSGQPERLAASVRSAIRVVDRDLPLASMRTGPELIGETLSSRRLNVVLLSLFAAVALLLAIIGVYGVLSYTVAQQTKEIGIRMAIGASARDVLTLMLWTGLWPVLVGAVVGLAAAFATTRVLEKMLFEISPADPATLFTAVLLLLVGGVVGVLVPARRAARLVPLMVVRGE
jgi:putative ABC transport system permease protein